MSSARGPSAPSSPTPSTTVASTSLDTLDTRQVRGSADVVKHDGRLDLTVNTEQPMDPAGGYLEVWLINKDLKRMVSVGVLEPGTKDQSFVIPKDLLDQGYVIVDISREGFDGAPAALGRQPRARHPGHLSRPRPAPSDRRQLRDARRRGGRYLGWAA